MKLFLDINAKKIETVISYFDNYLWKVGIQTKDYLNKRTKELEELENNFDSLQRNYESTHPTKEKIATLKSRVIEKLIENDGILQSDFWKMFDASEQESVKDIVYLLRLDGKIERVKSGRSFILHYKS